MSATWSTSSSRSPMSRIEISHPEQEFNHSLDTRTPMGRSSGLLVFGWLVI